MGLKAGKGVGKGKQPEARKNAPQKAISNGKYANHIYTQSLSLNPQV
jgi:hypothetical protein